MSGTDPDAHGDTGTWSYTLDVTAGTLTQVAPVAGATNPAGTAAFTAQLAVSGVNGSVAFSPATSARHWVSSGRARAESAPPGRWPSATTPSRAPTATPTATSGRGPTPSTSPRARSPRSPRSPARPTPGTSAGFGDQLVVSGAFGTVAFSPATSTPTGFGLLLRGGEHHRDTGRRRLRPLGHRP